MGHSTTITWGQGRTFCRVCLPLFPEDRPFIMNGLCPAKGSLPGIFLAGYFPGAAANGDRAGQEPAESAAQQSGGMALRTGAANVTNLCNDEIYLLSRNVFGLFGAVRC